MQQIRFIVEDRGAPKSAGPVAIATIVNPALPASQERGLNLAELLFVMFQIAVEYLLLVVSFSHVMNSRASWRCQQRLPQKPPNRLSGQFNNSFDSFRFVTPHTLCYRNLPISVCFSYFAEVVVTHVTSQTLLLLSTRSTDSRAG